MEVILTLGKISIREPAASHEHADLVKAAETIIKDYPAMNHAHTIVMVHGGRMGFKSVSLPEFLSGRTALTAR